MHIKVSTLLLATITCLFSLVLIVPPERTYAWQGDLPTCDIGNTYTELPNNFNAELNYIMSQNNQTNVNSYIIYGVADGTIAIVMSADENKLVIDKQGVTNEITVLSPTGNKYIFIAQPPTDINSNTFPTAGYITQSGYYDGQSEGRNFTTNEISNLTCIHGVKDITYSDDYTGQIYGEYDSRVNTNPTEECSTFDVLCFTSTIFANITDTFKSVGESIVAGIYYIFVPDTTMIQTMFDDLYLAFTQQLGILTFPLTFFTDMFYYLAYSNEVSNGAPLGNFFGSEMSISLDTIQQNFPVLTQTIKIFVQVGTILLLIAGIQMQYRRIVHA